jgi:hypothetical protein
MELVSLYEDGNLNLNPPYQRNSIWTLNSQKLLIDTLKRKWPLPTFFLQEKDKGFEMVDGQQRTRALLGYIDPVNGFSDSNNLKYQEGEFVDYNISIVTIPKETTVEEIREFYVRVNRSGAKLERPELNKAEYYNKKFLELSTELSEMIEFRELKIFSSANIRRMFDRDYVEEISALILKGPTDKKSTVDQLFKTDITDEEFSTVKATFTKIMEIAMFLNNEIPISETRFNQKNDFYTLFGILMKIKNLKNEDILGLYKVLIHISQEIRPSNDECQILKEYAENCVTQSNSKKARQRRQEILESLILNDSDQMTEEQSSVAKYYKLDKGLTKFGEYYTFLI